MGDFEESPVAPCLPGDSVPSRPAAARAPHKVESRTYRPAAASRLIRLIVGMGGVRRSSVRAPGLGIRPVK
jgi:hypothetical protein